MAFRKTFVVSAERVNCFGFIVKTAGINLDQAQKNCPCFYSHDRDDLPLGHWENFRIEGDELLADVIIDGENDEEKTYIRKIQNGDIKGATIGADPVRWNVEGPVPVLEECLLFEISLEALPAQYDALCLKHGNAFVKLSANNANDIVPKKHTYNMKSLAILLGLPETATEAQLTEKINGLIAKANAADAITNNVAVELSKKLPEDKREFFISLSKTNIEQGIKFFNMVSGDAPAAGNEAPAAAPDKAITISSLIELGKKGAAAAAAPQADTTTYDYLQKKNPVELSRIRREEPAKYAELAKAYGQGVRYTGQ